MVNFGCQWWVLDGWMDGRRMSFCEDGTSQSCVEREKQWRVGKLAGAAVAISVLVTANFVRNRWKSRLLSRQKTRER